MVYQQTKSVLSNRKVNTKSDAYLMKAKHILQLRKQFILTEDDIVKYKHKIIPKSEFL